MPAAELLPSRYSPSPDRRSRIIAGLLSLAVLALILATLIEMGVIDLDTGPALPPLVTVQVPPPPAISGGGSKRKQVAKQAPRAATTPVPQPHPTAPHPVPSAPPATSFIHLSNEEFAAADIGKMARPDSDTSGEGSAEDSSKTYGPGEGPGGEHLYNAEWYRKPSDAEIDTYIQHGAPDGATADIACRTAEHFHVEDCEELDESPPGSGLSRALREAAWQFLVRPPRLNGRPLIGKWVRIHFDFITRRASETDSPPQP